MRLRPYCRFGTLTLWIHGYLQATHNWSERALRVPALGRKNYLFFGGDEPGENIAGLYSLVQSCEVNGTDPQLYLADVLVRVKRHPHARIDELLPHRWSASTPNTS